MFSRLGFALGATLLAGMACREPTELRVLVSTSATCSDLSTTGVAVGRLGAELEQKYPATTSRACGADGVIGEVVIAPSDGESDEIAFKVVTGVHGQAADLCTAPAYQGCIVARRALRFEPHTAVDVAVSMDISCLNVPCGELDTCFQGRCVSARCVGNAGCQSAADAGADAAAATTSTVPPPVPPASIACDPVAGCSATGKECAATTHTCVDDRLTPRLLGASTLTPGTLRVYFSEAVGDAAGVSTNYCVKLDDNNPASCSSTGSPITKASLAPDRLSVDLTLQPAIADGAYVVSAKNVQDLAGLALTAPTYASFRGVETFLRLVAARPTSPTTIDLVFSQPPTLGPDMPHSAECSSSAECAKRYLLTGTSSLGGVMTAALTPGTSNEVTLTHANAQGSAAYTVIFANGTNGDGFDDASFGPIGPASGKVPDAGRNPIDRAFFFGAGAALPPTTLDGGPLAVDPFGDGTATTSLVLYNDAVYLAPGRNGRSAIRVRPNGSRPEMVSFFVQKDTTGNASRNNYQTTSNNQGPYLLFLGSPGCAVNVDCGPDNEDARVRFASGTIGGTPYLAAIGGQSSLNLRYLYTSAETDPFLFFRYVDISPSTDSSSRGGSAVAFQSDRLYVGLTEVSSNPRLLALSPLLEPTGSVAGIDPVGNGASACNATTTPLCDLAAAQMPALGGGASPTGIDVIATFGTFLYVANRGGIMRSTVGVPLDFAHSPADWKVVTPSPSDYLGKASSTTQKSINLDPVDRAWSGMVTYRGRLYASRNTTTGPQLWVCQPVLGVCESSNWTLAARNATGDLALTQFDTPANAQITMLTADSSALYVGFDNAAGVKVYRSSADTPTTEADFVPITTGGFGRAANTRIFDALSATDVDGHSYVYVVTGDGTTPVRLHRTQD